MDTLEIQTIIIIDFPTLEQGSYNYFSLQTPKNIYLYMSFIMHVDRTTHEGIASAIV